MYIGLHVKYPLLLYEFNDTLIFSIDPRKNLQIPNLIKICSMGAEFFHAEEQKKPTAGFRNFANAPENPKHSDIVYADVTDRPSSRRSE